MPRSLCAISKHQLQLRKQRIQRLAWANHIWLAEIADIRRTVAGAVSEYVAKASTGLKRRSAEGNRDVVYQERPVRDTEAVVESDVVPDGFERAHTPAAQCDET